MYRYEIVAWFDDHQHGVNTRTADIRVSIYEIKTHKLVKFFPMAVEIKNETEKDYTVDFRKVYRGRQENKWLYKLGVERFSKGLGASEKIVEIEGD